ncbi:MAG: putative lipid II flippase FtsW [Candidatus Omnitrophica bacterium]|nr:putative lipid II flippase FtsW [Candidatus Omnitrophota bacterium]
MRNIRISIACIAFILILFGIIMVYSSSAIYAYEVFGDSFHFLKRQLIAAVIGLILCVCIMGTNIEDVKRHSRQILLISILPLILVLLPGIGKTVGGAKRWIDLGFFSIQPSEVAKIALLIYLADFVSRKRALVRDFIYGYLPPLMVIGCVIFLILMEPDLGTAIAVGLVGFLVLFVAGVKVSHVTFTAAFSLPFLYYLLFKVPYRRRRLLAFINPWMDEKGAGFQIIQSFLAFGSGGLLGVGLGQSRQKLFFLPASHTDFVFSIIGEELGFIGAFSVIILFAVLIWQGARAAFKIDDDFRKYLIFGIIFMIAFEVIVNAGVACGLFPTKGLPLPLVSYGGTSLIMHMAAIGLLLNAAKGKV